MKNSWENNEKFSEYKESLLLLDKEDKMVQNKKRTNIFVIMENSLHKHFGIWAGQLLFLSVYSNQPSASLVVRRVIRGRMGRRQEDVVSYYDKDHKKTVNLQKFNLFLEKYVRTEAINDTRNLPFVKNNATALSLVADGIDMWNVSIPALVELQTTYIHRYAALPTNTQFGERGVKESGYVSLGRRNESSRSIPAISRGTLLPEALAAGRLEIESPNENKKRQLQGKQKAKVLMREFFVHNKKLNRYCKSARGRATIYKQSATQSEQPLLTQMHCSRPNIPMKNFAASRQRQMRTHLPMFTNVALAKL